MDASNPKSKIGAPASAGHPELPKRLRPPQFGLRTLLLLVTACAFLLALERWFSLAPIAVAALVLLALSIFAHVAGNAIGTRLREIGDQPDDGGADQAYRFRQPQAGDFAPATQLSQRQSLGWTIVVATITGTIAGGIGGGLWTWLASSGPIGPLNIAVGVVAFGVLGGIGAFTTVGLTQVLCGAIWQALHSAPTDSRPLTPDS
jgi:hypothetical protein